MMEHLDNAKGVNLASTAYHAVSSLLITAFTNGVFLLHEMPDFNLIQSLRYVLFTNTKLVSNNFEFNFVISFCPLLRINKISVCTNL